MADDTVVTNSDDTSEEPEPRPVTRSRKLRRLLVPLVLVTAAWFTPALVVNTPLRAHFLRAVTPEMNGHLEAGACRVGWLSPVAVDDLLLIDPDGETVVHIEHAQTSRPLWRLLTAMPDFGDIRLSGVTGHIHIRGDGSNIEDILQPMLEQPAGVAPVYKLTLADSSIVIDAEGCRTATAITDVEGTVASTEWGAACPVIELAGRVRVSAPSSADESSEEGPSPQAPSRMPSAQAPVETGEAAGWKLTLGWTDQPTGLTGEMRLATESLSLESFNSLLARFANGTIAAGTARCDLEIAWSAEQASSARVRGGLAASSIALEAPDWIGPDRFTLAALKFGGGIAVRDDVLHFDDVRIACDIGELNANGVLRAGEGRLLPTARDPLQLAGAVDLARLIDRLPGTLGLHEDVRMDSGRAVFDLETRRDGQQTVVSGSLETSSLRASRRGQSIAWDDPLQLDFQVRDTGADVLIDRLLCRSEFLTIEGSGTLDRADVTAQCDLSRLKRRIADFVVVDNWDLSGQLTLEAGLQRFPNEDFEASLLVRTRDLAVRNGTQVWREEDLVLSGLAAGRLEGTRIARLDKGHIRLTSSGDLLHIELTDPLAPEEFSQGTPVAFRIKGAVSTWHQRLRPFATPPGPALRGRGEVAGVASVTRDVVHLDETRIVGSGLRLPIGDLVYEEPQVQGSLSARIDLQERTVDLPSFNWHGQTLRLDGRDLAGRFGARPRASGRITVDADLAGIRRQSTGDDTGWTGRFTGTANVDAAGGVTQADLSGKLTDSNLTPFNRHPEARLTRDSFGNIQATSPASLATIACRLKYNHVTDSCTIETARATADGLVVEASGSVSDVGTTATARLRGSVQYDFDRVNALLQRRFGNHVKLAGRGNHPFRITGPLASGADGLVGEGEFDWDSAEVFGLRAGKGRIHAELQDGVCRIAPITFAMNGGQAHLLPRIDLKDRPTLLFARGTELRDVDLSDAVTREWMEYVAPALADSTRIRGRFSTALAGAVIPMDAPVDTDAGGTLRIHSANAAPGPLVERLFGTVASLQQILGSRPVRADSLQLTLPPQDVEFRMVKRRVHHRTLTMEVDGVNITTSGSVGLDQSLNLVARIPIPGKWVGSSRWARSLEGQVVAIPVSGSLRSPRVDPRVLQDLATRAAGDAVQDRVQDEIDRGLNRLLDSIR